MWVINMHKIFKHGDSKMEKVGAICTTDEPEKFLSTIAGMGGKEVSPRTHNSVGELENAIVLLEHDEFRVYFLVDLLPQQIDYTRFENQMKGILNLFAKRILH